MWICPFCGGLIVLLGTDGEGDHIRCDSCDMRIDIFSGFIAED
jgi:hypothetical protein